MCDEWVCDECVCVMSVQWLCLLTSALCVWSDIGEEMVLVQHLREPCVT